MTYCIFSLESGTILESYRSEEVALEAAARIYRAEPEARDSFAVITFDDRGQPVDSLEGAALAERVESFNAAHA